MTVKELREIIKTEVALLISTKNFYDYSKIYTTRTELEYKPVYPNPLSEPYCQGSSDI